MNTILPFDTTLPIISFIFVCLIFPRLIRHRPYFYIALASVVVAMIFNTLMIWFPVVELVRFLGGFAQLLQVLAFLLLVMSAGELSAGDLVSGFGEAFEAMRDPDRHRPVIVPLSGDQPKPREKAPFTPGEPTERYNLTPEVTPPTPAEEEGQIPME